MNKRIGRALITAQQNNILLPTTVFIVILMAMPLILMAMPPSSQPNIGDIPPPMFTSIPIPTARVISTPSVQSEVVLPTPTAPSLEEDPETSTPTSSTSITKTTAISRGPVVREGPGGLPYPLRIAHLNFGVVGHFYYTDRARALTLAREAGFGWVRQQIHWRDIEDHSGSFFWDELDNIVADASNQGLLLMISIVRSPNWYTADGSDGMPQDPETLARFLGTLVEHYPDQIHAIQIWNEQNLAYENGGHITLEDAGRYVELLAACYRSIKAVDPRVIVVAGAPAPTGINNPNEAIPDIDYLRAMYRYKNGMIRDYFDVQAVHPFGSANPPDTLWPDKPSPAQGWTDSPTFYFRHIENLRRVMEEEGLGYHQVWVTEFGWATYNNTPGYEYGNQMTFEKQRDYIVGAMQYTVDNYPWVSNMFVWNLNFTILQKDHGVNPLHEQGSFSILNADWTPRPAYYGIQQFIRQRFLAQGE